MLGGPGPKGTNIACLSIVFKNVDLKVMLDTKYLFIIKVTMKKNVLAEDMMMTNVSFSPP